LLIVEILGIASGYVSILVFALYLNTEKVLHAFRSVEIIWLLVPLLLFWVSSMWMQAHRDKMHDDPIVHAIFDQTSYVIGILSILILVVAKFFNLNLLM
jgi:4-hydroxybenzoate polyprenyltransferase